MSRLTLVAVLAISLACARTEDDATTLDANAQDAATAASSAAEDWVPAPGLPEGAHMRVVSGDPSQPGDFVVQLRFPNDYQVPPHTHPQAETVTIVSGLLHVGMGETYSMENVDEMTPGESASVAANQPHFAHAAGETVIEVRSTGPFEIRMVGP